MKFSNQVQSKVTMTDEQNNSYNIAGINGTISSADSVIGGLSAILDIVGWQVNDVVRVVNQDVVEGSSPVDKSEPTLSIGEWSLTQDTVQGAQAPITYNGDGTLYATSDKLVRIVPGGTPYLFVGAQSNFSGTLYATEGNNYLAKSIPFSKS